MSTQIAVRLPDALVADLDALIAKGEVKSRASVVERALRRELRRLQYAEEAKYWDAHPEALDDPDLQALSSWVDHASKQPMDID